MLVLLGMLLGITCNMVYQSMFGCKSRKNKQHNQKNNSKLINELVDNSLEEEDNWESESDEDGSDFKRNQAPDQIEEAELFANYPISDIKMVLVVNNGLKMGKGKIGA